MRRTRFLGIIPAIVFLAVLVASCSGEPNTGEPNNGEPKPDAMSLTLPWEVGEKSVYEVKRGDEVLATWEMRVESDEAGIALVSELEGDGFRELARVKVDPVTLFPEAMSFTQETDSGKAGYTATFTSEEAIISIDPETDGQEVPPVKVAIPEGPHYENETLLMAIRAMPLDSAFTTIIQDVVTRAARVAPVEIRVVREEEIETVLGQKDAFVVELVGFEQYLWVAKDAPRQILRFENKLAETVSELKEYTGN
jgi:hypothetical protein